MLIPLLLAALAGSAARAATSCVNGSTPVTTAAIVQPGGKTATLRVQTHDDFAKATHLCQSDYALLITTPNSTSPAVVDLFTNDDAWGRSIAFHLDGYTHDGRLVGVLSEGGKYPFAQLFTSREAAADTFGLAAAFSPRLAIPCLASLTVVGTTEDGLLVLSSEARSPCRAEKRFKLKMRSGKNGQTMQWKAEPYPVTSPLIPLDSSKL